MTSRLPRPSPPFVLSLSKDVHHATPEHSRSVSLPKPGSPLRSPSLSMDERDA
jgi:hypothetical protein